MPVHNTSNCKLVYFAVCLLGYASETAMICVPNIRKSCYVCISWHVSISIACTLLQQDSDWLLCLALIALMAFWSYQATLLGASVSIILVLLPDLSIILKSLQG